MDKFERECVFIAKYQDKRLKENACLYHSAKIAGSSCQKEMCSMLVLHCACKYVIHSKILFSMDSASKIPC